MIVERLFPGTKNIHLYITEDAIGKNSPSVDERMVGKDNFEIEQKYSPYISQGSFLSYASR